MKKRGTFTILCLFLLIIQCRSIKQKWLNNNDLLNQYQNLLSASNFRDCSPTRACQSYKSYELYTFKENREHSYDSKHKNIPLREGEVNTKYILDRSLKVNPLDEYVKKGGANSSALMFVNQLNDEERKRPQKFQNKNNGKMSNFQYRDNNIQKKTRSKEIFEEIIQNIKDNENLRTKNRYDLRYNKNLQIMVFKSDLRDNEYNDDVKKNNGSGNGKKYNPGTEDDDYDSQRSKGKGKSKGKKYDSGTEDNDSRKPKGKGKGKKYDSSIEDEDDDSRKPKRTGKGKKYDSGTEDDDDDSRKPKGKGKGKGKKYDSGTGDDDDDSRKPKGTGKGKKYDSGTEDDDDDSRKPKGKGKGKGKKYYSGTGYDDDDSRKPKRKGKGKKYDSGTEDDDDDNRKPKGKGKGKGKKYDSGTGDDDDDSRKPKGKGKGKKYDSGAEDDGQKARGKGKGKKYESGSEGDEYDDQCKKGDKGKNNDKRKKNREYYSMEYVKYLCKPRKPKGGGGGGRGIRIIDNYFKSGVLNNQWNIQKFLHGNNTYKIDSVKQNKNMKTRMCILNTYNEYCLGQQVK